MPFVVTFPVDFDNDLSNIRSEKFRKVKSSIETILYKAFLKLLSKAPTAIQVTSFA